MSTHVAVGASQLRPSWHRALHLVRRNVFAYKHFWIAFVTGFFEPLFYLVGVGFGVGQFVQSVPYGDIRLDYASFLAPGLLAAATMNGALFDGFFTPFFKLNWMKTYDGIITTPLSITDIAVGEVLWAVIRGTIYGLAVLVVMVALGLVHSPWALLALPAVTLSGAALSAGAMVLTAVTREISSLEKVLTLVILPLFLFSGTFYPVSLYPDSVRPVIQALPLFHSATLLRDLTTGQVDLSTIGHVAYLLTMFVTGSAAAIHLIGKRLIF